MLTCLIPVTAQNREKPSLPTSDGNWLYVGGSGPGNYTRIQDAINVSSEGDTVYVYSGIYSDYLTEYSAGVVITKAISLIGENKYSTILNGSAEWRSVVTIMADGVCIHGFTIQNCKHGLAAVLIEEPTRLHDIQDLVMYECIIQVNEVGIASVSELSDSVFHHILFSNNTNGIQLTWCTNCSVYNNNISHNMIGIGIDSVESNVIEYNDIVENTVGIEAISSHGTIMCNNFIKNEQHATFRNWFLNTIILVLPLLLYYTQDWDNNYWDDWTTSHPRPIRGEWAVMFGLGNIHYLWGPFLWVQFDWHPAQEPYDISG